MDAGQKPTWLDGVYGSTVYRIATLVGLGVALITAPLALPPVQSTLFPKQSRLSVQIRRETPAIDVDRQFSGLSVIYRGQDLVANHSGLIVSQIRITNTGSVSIAETNISKSDPLGVRVTGGKVLGIVAFSASSNHLVRRGKPRVADNIVTLPANIIFDPRDFVSFDLLVLKRDASKLNYTSVGKVEGIRTIPVEKGSLEDQEPSLFWKSFSGTGAVQTTRIVGYTVFSVLALVFIALCSEQIRFVKDKLRVRRRKRLCNRVRNLNTDMDREHWVFISAAYTTYGSASLRYLRRDVFRKQNIYNTVENVPKVKRRKNESVPVYIRRALAKRVPLWQLQEYLDSVAKEAGISIDQPQNMAALRENVIRFEKSLEEAAAEAGIPYDSLDNKTRTTDRFITDFNLPANFNETVTVRKVSSNEQN